MINRVSSSEAATIAQTGTALQVELKAPALVTASVRLNGLVIDRRATVFLPSDDFYYATYGIRYYALLEMLGTDRFLALEGTARGERAGAAVTGTLDGEFALYRSGDASGARNRQFSCRRNDHGFRLDRN